MFGNCGGLDRATSNILLNSLAQVSEYMSKATAPTKWLTATISVWLQDQSTGTYQVILNDGYTSNQNLYFLDTEWATFEIPGHVTGRGITDR